MWNLYYTNHSVFNYDEIPAGYYHVAMHSGHRSQQFWHQEKFKFVAKKISSHSQLLDLGCGPGSFLDILKDKIGAIKAVGVDIASRQIDYAKKHIETRGGEKDISFEKLPEDSAVLPYPSSSFDFVTAIELVEHMHPHVAMHLLFEANRVLKEDGRMIVTTPNYRSSWPLLERILEKRSPVQYHNQHINKFTPNSFVKFLETGGFDVVNIETLFILSPFIAPISTKFADFLMHIEQRPLFRRFGCLLVAELKKNALFDQSRKEIENSTLSVA